jgi:hypothetical protein
MNEQAMSIPELLRIKPDIWPPKAVRGAIF